MTMHENDDSSTNRNSKSTESMHTSEMEDPVPKEMVGTPPRLKLSVLKNEMKLKPHVKARGRPKHTGTVWPSKSKAKNGKQKKKYTRMPERRIFHPTRCVLII